MSNPDRLRREAQEHAETLVEDRGLANALAWAIHCANRSTDGFWSRVVQAIERLAEETECDCCGEMKASCVDLIWCGMDVHACPKCRHEEDDNNDLAANRGDYEFHRDHNQ
jgi:hypothetical protein